MGRPVFCFRSRQGGNICPYLTRGKRVPSFHRVFGRIPIRPPTSILTRVLGGRGTTGMIQRL